MHVFIPRYLLVAMPGIALCWGWICSAIESRALRAFFCFAFVALCLFQAYSSPLSRSHEESWKEALAFADANAAADHAPLLMCSPLVEADFQPMPEVASDSVLYSPLSYYKVSAPVVPLPRTLNGETERQAKQFLLKAAQEHTRFLVLAPWPSLRIVDLLAYDSQPTHTYRVLGNFDEIFVVEFVPYSDTAEFADEALPNCQSRWSLRRIPLEFNLCKRKGSCMSLDYLLKTEASVYSFADLQREKVTLWDGVTNPAAVKNLREMTPGVRLVMYETGDRKSAVGTASVVSVDATDPRNPLVKIKVGKALPQPVSLAQIKANGLFADSPLVRQGRLSVVPLTKAQYRALTGE
jgi:predicted RNA-binding protein with PUA-like domain